MQMTSPTSVEIMIMLWFAVSVFVTIISTFVFWIWLIRHGVKLTYMWVGTPGYLEFAYLKWCRSQGRLPSKIVVSFRTISIINVIVAAVFLIAVASKT